jgi:hypothetical protein
MARHLLWRRPVTLKALTYAPTGGIVAAPTTSLPEHLGGRRNWDYRYCWLRDATFTSYALIGAGYLKEAEAWREWLLRAVAGAPDELHIMYGIAGERRLPELELDWLPGYENSRPVRIGNGAYRQSRVSSPTVAGMRIAFLQARPTSTIRPIWVKILFAHGQVEYGRQQQPEERHAHLGVPRVWQRECVRQTSSTGRGTTDSSPPRALMTKC